MTPDPRENPPARPVEAAVEALERRLRAFEAEMEQRIQAIDTTLLRLDSRLRNLRND
jgi:hypothetical protein